MTAPTHVAFALSLGLLGGLGNHSLALKLLALGCPSRPRSPGLISGPDILFRFDSA